MAGAPKNPETKHRRSVLGGLSLQYPPDHPKVIAARRELEFCTLADHVAAVVCGWPPPTEEQLDRIAGLLRTGSRGGDAP